MAKVPFNTTIPEEVRDGIKARAVDGKSQGDVVTEAYRQLVAPPKSDGFQVDVNRWFRETWARLDEIRETVQSVEPPPTSPASIREVLDGLDPQELDEEEANKLAKP